MSPLLRLPSRLSQHTPGTKSCPYSLTSCCCLCLGVLKSKPNTARPSRATASLARVSRLVLCCPLSIREITEAVVRIRTASCCCVRPSCALRIITSRAISSNGGGLVDGVSDASTDRTYRFTNHTTTLAVLLTDVRWFHYVPSSFIS